MKAEDVRRALTTPIGAPAYPSGGPYRFTDREYLNITYRTDADAMRAVVPEPLTVGDPLVTFEVMKMPDVVQKFAVYGAEPIGGSGADMNTFIQAERNRWKKVIETAKVTVD